MKKDYLDTILSGSEKILYVVHQHWTSLASRVMLKAVFLLFVLSLTVTAVYFYPDRLLLLAVIGLGSIALLAVAIIRDFANWTNRMYVITNRRVIQLSGLLNKQVIDSSLEKVNDIRMDQSFLGRILGYGDIEILTASESGINRFLHMDQPIRFKTALLTAKMQLERDTYRLPVNDTFAPPDIIRMLDRLNDLKVRGVISEEEFLSKKTELLSKI